MNPEPESRHYDRYKARSLKAYNSKMVERYDSLFWHRVAKTNAWDEEILAEIGSEIPSLRVLDIGCATGRLLSHLAKAGAKHLYGTDLAPNILKVARRKLAGSEAKVELKPADAEDTLPWPDDFFDVAVLSGVLPHLYRPQDALEEIRRVLVHGGRLIVVEPRLPAIIRHVINGGLFCFPHNGECRYRSAKLVGVLLRSSSFVEIRSKKVGRLGFMMVASTNKSGKERSPTSGSS